MSDMATDPNRAYYEEMYELLIQTPDLVALFDADDCLRAANPAYCEAYHCDPAQRLSWHEIMRANYLNNRGPVIETEDIDAWLTDAKARRSTIPYRSFEVELNGGKWIWITETVSRHGWMFFHASDISSLRSSSRHLRLERDVARRASWTDELTGIPNRRYIMARLEEWLNAQRTQPDFGIHSLAVIDLDDFKALNDRYGHKFGDDVLIAFCRKVVGSIRPRDLFGRIGGEEFLFLMPNCAVQVARDRLNLLQQMIRRPDYGADNLNITHTFSAGLVLVQEDEDIHHAIRRADRLMYRAKAEGRARIIC